MAIIRAHFRQFIKHRLGDLLRAALLSALAVPSAGCASGRNAPGTTPLPTRDEWLGNANNVQVVESAVVKSGKPPLRYLTQSRARVTIIEAKSGVAVAQSTVAKRSIISVTTAGVLIGSETLRALPVVADREYRIEERALPPLPSGASDASKQATSRPGVRSARQLMAEQGRQRPPP